MTTEGPAGEVWRDDPCLLTVPSRWKDDAPDLKRRSSGIKPHSSDSTFAQMVSNTRVFPPLCSWLLAIPTCSTLPLVQGKVTEFKSPVSQGKELLQP